MNFIFNLQNIKSNYKNILYYFKLNMNAKNKDWFK